MCESKLSFVISSNCNGHKRVSGTDSIQIFNCELPELQYNSPTGYGNAIVTECRETVASMRRFYRYYLLYR